DEAGARGVAGERGDVAVARAPRIAQERARLDGVERGGAVAHEIERATQRGAPRLAKAGRAGGAAAVARPAADAVRAAPRGAFAARTFLEPRLGPRRMRREIGGVVGDGEAAARRFDAERVGERALAPARVVAIRLAVGGDVDELVAVAVGYQRRGE